MEFHTRLNQLSSLQLKEICKKLGIQCPQRKQDIVNKLLRPLESIYKMEQSREEKRKLREKEREEKRKLREKEREEKRKSRELQQKSRELQRKSRELIRESRKMEREKDKEVRKMERDIKRQERQKQIEKWKQEGKDNVEIVDLLLKMNIN